MASPPPTLDAIEGSEVAAILKDEERSVVVLDVRGFPVYNNGHVTGAHNLILSPMLQRRLAKPGSTLKYVLPQQLHDVIYDKESDGPGRLIVVYDMDGPNATGAASKPVLVDIVVMCLMKELESAVRVLTGGYSAFSKDYPELCIASGVPKATGLCNKCETTTDKCRCVFRTGMTPLSAPIMSPRSLTLNKPGGPIGGMPLSPIHGGESPMVAGSTTGVHAMSDSGLGEDRFPSEIQSHLLLGSSRHSSDLDALQSKGVTAILNISTSCPCYFESKFTYRKVPVNDTMGASLMPYFDELSQFIDAIGRSGGKVLVHCAAGISRSPTICIAHMMRTKNMTFHEGFDFVKTRRPSIAPNISFMGQLMVYQDKLRGTSKSPRVQNTPSPPVFPTRCTAPRSASDGERSPEDGPDFPFLPKLSKLHISA